MKYELLLEMKKLNVENLKVGKVSPYNEISVEHDYLIFKNETLHYEIKNFFEKEFRKYFEMKFDFHDTNVSGFIHGLYWKLGKKLLNYKYIKINNLNNDDIYLKDITRANNLCNLTLNSVSDLVELFLRYEPDPIKIGECFQNTNYKTSKVLPHLLNHITAVYKTSRYNCINYPNEQLFKDLAYIVIGGIYSQVSEEFHYEEHYLMELLEYSNMLFINIENMLISTLDKN